MPKRLYIAADGPRTHQPDDIELCIQTRAIVVGVDWDCVVKTLYRETNLGCKEAVSSAIDWFFSYEEAGIVLEDDCLPANSFFDFCDTLLEKYRHDARVRHIAGTNLQLGKKWGLHSYYFSNKTHVWGWASWRRAWKDYDKNLTEYETIEIEGQLSNIYNDPLIIASLKNIFESVKANKIDTWDFQLDFANYFNNGLTIIPNVNLISNIGFDKRATHTLDEGSVYANLPLEEMGEITHPVFILPQKQADLTVLNRDFDLVRKRKKQNAWHRKLKRWYKAKLR